jgi:DNA-binding NtrC family response regulator
MKLLIIDDDPGLRDSLARLLKFDGHDVQAEGSPRQALNLATREPFDLILCDVQMPDLTGPDFLRRYKSAGGAALVIMMSAYSDEDAAIQAMEWGAYDYLAKPFRPDQLALTIRQAEERELLKNQLASLEAELEQRRSGEYAGVAAEADHIPRRLDDYERQHIEEVLRHHRGNRTHASRELGIARTTLIKKIKNYNLNA